MASEFVIRELVAVKFVTRVFQLVWLRADMYWTW